MQKTIPHNNNQFLFEDLQILNSAPADLDIIFELFASAIAYQEKKGYNRWPLFSRKLIETEMAEERHWKILDATMTVGVFSVLYNDPVIWGERNKDAAVYLHRIAVHPSFKGRGLMRVINSWAGEHAKQKQIGFVRMDTWGDNENLRKYYISCGFNYIGQQFVNDVHEGEGHYGGPVLSLFQNEI